MTYKKGTTVVANITKKNPTKTGIFEQQWPEWSVSSSAFFVHGFFIVCSSAFSVALPTWKNRTVPW